MAHKMNNPRFPHSCVIRRISGQTAFSDGKSKEVYTGECRRFANTNQRVFRSGSTTVGQVVYGDYRVSMPGKVGIRPGDTATVTHDLGEDIDVTVLHPNYSPLPTREAPEGCTEFYYSLASI